MIDTDFILRQILQSEGWPQYTDRASDRGGPTKGGITLATLREWRIDPAVTADSLKLLSQQEAESIYRHLYIDGPGFARINDGLLRWHVIDCGVLSGTGRATRWLQRAVGAVIDGVLGPESLAAVNAASPYRTSVQLAVTRLRFFADIVAHDEEQAANLLGWVNRATTFLLREAGR